MTIRRFLILISAGLCLGICVMWYRSISTCDGFTWCRYRECGLPLKEFRATILATRYGGIEIFESREQFTCSPKDMPSVPIDWNDDIDQHRGIRFGSAPSVQSDTEPEVTLKDQIAFASGDWWNCGARPWAVAYNLIGTHTEARRMSRIPLWPSVLLTAVLPLHSLWKRRWHLFIRITKTRTAGFPVSIGGDVDRKGDIPD